jgi:TolB protein
MRIFKIIFLLLIASTSLAATRVDINRGNIDPIKIAINNFEVNSSLAQTLAVNIDNVVAYDLSNSGLFRLISRDSFVEKISFNTASPDFSSWRIINAVATITGRVDEMPGGNIKVAFKIWDNYNEKLIKSLSFDGSKSNFRKLAHKIADEIYSTLTGYPGYFNSRIAFIEESGNPFRKVKKIAVIDQDGANLRYITDGRDLALTPRLSPDNNRLIYLSYKSKTPKVYLYDFNGNKHHLLGEFPGMSYAPRFSPDSNNVVLSVARGGSSSIFKINLRSLEKTLLSSGPYIDTTPCYSPNGDKIIFSSDRSGKAQLYVMNSNGTNQQRITYGNGNYHTPVWSPSGDFIAFTKTLSGQFHIGVMRADGSGERLITSGYSVEGPNFAPNGRTIIYAKGAPSSRKKLGKSRLMTIDITGLLEKELQVNFEGSDPAWSTLLP